MSFHSCPIEPDDWANGPHEPLGEECHECSGTGEVVDDQDREHTCTIDLWPIEEECWACGQWVCPLRHGLPVYEDEILHNDYEGEWGGVPSCQDCFDLHSETSRRQSLS